MKSKTRTDAAEFVTLRTDRGALMVACRIERSPRLKRMYLHLNSRHEVVLKLPLRASLQGGMRFLQQNGDWIREHMAKRASVPSLKQHLLRRPRLSAHGQWVPLQMSFQRGGIGPMLVCGPQPKTIYLRVPDFTDEVLIRLLKRCAQDVLPPRLAHHANRHGLKYHGVQIRDQRQRWGSCSETGSISLNWRLVLLPPHLQDHVLLHELAHLHAFDHSVVFHRFLAQMDTDANAHSEELRQISPGLIQLGRLAP